MLLNKTGDKPDWSEVEMSWWVFSNTDGLSRWVSSYPHCLMTVSMITYPDPPPPRVGWHSNVVLLAVSSVIYGQLILWFWVIYACFWLLFIELTKKYKWQSGCVRNSCMWAEKTQFTTINRVMNHSLSVLLNTFTQRVEACLSLFTGFTRWWWPVVAWSFPLLSTCFSHPLLLSPWRAGSQH